MNQSTSCCINPPHRLGAKYVKNVNWCFKQKSFLLTRSIVLILELFIWTYWNVYTKKEKYLKIWIFPPFMGQLSDCFSNREDWIKFNYTNISSIPCASISTGIFKSTCHIDVRWFPFDVQRCDLKFGSWTYGGWSLDLQMIEADITGYIANGEWDLVGKKNLYQQKKKNQTWNQTILIWEQWDVGILYKIIYGFKMALFQGFLTSYEPLSYKCPSAMRSVCFVLSFLPCGPFFYFLWHDVHRRYSLSSICNRPDFHPWLVSCIFICHVHAGISVELNCP